MLFSGRLTLTGTFASILTSATAGFNAGSPANIAVYWGQNSYNQESGLLAQQRLSYYCANSNIDIIPVAFLVGIKTPALNFANQGANCSLIDGSTLIRCPELEEDIKICQSQYKKKILLSLGGAAYTEGGFFSPSEAITNADKLWSLFGPTSDTAAARPFGTAVIDGFDFDFESTTSNLIPFAQRLQQLANISSSNFIFTSAPQCPYPDQAVGAVLSSAVMMDAVFVQYYNNFCGVSGFIEGVDTQPSINIDAWDKWAQTVSANPNVKVIIGVPGNVGGASSGYIPADKMKAVIAYAKRFSSFGGIMVWDATQAYSNPGFLETIRTALVGQIATGSTSVVSSPDLLASSKTAAHSTIPSRTLTTQDFTTLAPNQFPTPLPNVGHAIMVVRPNGPIVNSPTVGNNDFPTTLQTVTIKETSAAGSLPTMTTTSSTPTHTETVPEQTSTGSLVGEWNQCGGIEYAGPTECEPGLMCTKGGSEWWYACKRIGYQWRA